MIIKYRISNFNRNIYSKLIKKNYYISKNSFLFIKKIKSYKNLYQIIKL